jgi:CRISPR-associated protein Csy1
MTPPETSQWRSAIHDFIRARMEVKLEGLEKDKQLTDEERHHRREALEQSYAPAAWLADAAQRAKQIQLASHTVKPIHPEARGSSIYVTTYDAPPELVSSGSVKAESRALDVVGNAAALDIFKLLKLSPGNGHPRLLDALLQGDPAAMAALDDDPATATRLSAQLTQLAEAPSTPATHTHGKQLYFPLEDSSDHLLAPLYPSVLVHAAHEHLQHHRFSEAVQAARKARKEQQLGDTHRDYLQLLTQNFGGTKPQNISQLNSERGGRSHLFASLPPTVDPSFLVKPFGQTSVFAKNGAFHRFGSVRATAHELRELLAARAGRKANVEVRDRRAELVEALIDAVFDFAAEMHRFEAGWTNDERCKLVEAERRWLDPHVAADPVPEPPADDDDLWFITDLASQVTDDPTQHWTVQIARAFAGWLNAAIHTKDNTPQIEEFQEWQRLIAPRLSAMSKELRHD